MLLSRHWMSAKKTARDLVTEDSAGALHNFLFGAANIRDEHIRRRNGANPFNQINNGSNRRSQQNKITATNGLSRIFYRCIQRSHLGRATQNVSAVAPNTARLNARSCERQVERAAKDET